MIWHYLALEFLKMDQNKTIGPQMSKNLLLPMRHMRPKRRCACLARGRGTWRLQYGLCMLCTVVQSRCPIEHWNEKIKIEAFEIQETFDFFVTKSYRRCWWRSGCHRETYNNLGILCDLAAPGWPAHFPRGSSNCKEKALVINILFWPFRQ